ncbi:MAG: GDSL-type esterase/lipase family protein [Salinivirgaceae bacterium]|nr:GDSL-type esterase/lipase family protein [Salinivirgaceae bacterium]MDD4746139.1 GDSL-type esterase/lipase family protein [Salinivirgaceae bacterium]
MPFSPIKRYTKRILLAPILAFVISTCAAQDDPFQITQYQFIDYELNHIDDVSGRFANKLTKSIIQLIDGNEKTIIAHIGDSHIQADFFTSNIRNKLQMLHPGMSGSRGLIFPYNLAETNNPHNYQCTSNNEWVASYSTKIKEPSEIGLYGVKITTTDTIINLIINIKDSISESFNTINLWYGSEKEGNIWIETSQTTLQFNIEPGADKNATYQLPNYERSVNIKIALKAKGKFDIFGVEFGNDLPGIEYHAIGINGASAESYNRCLFFENQLQRLQPTLIVLSLGTNDAYAGVISPTEYKEKYTQLLNTIKRACPLTPILLTTPNNHARRGVDMSLNINTINKVIKTVAKENNLAFWDFHSIMGGHNSIQQWQYDSLAARDLIHLSPKGYTLKADLFYIALLKLYDANVGQLELTK